jgi:hypothetical protein
MSATFDARFNMATILESTPQRELQFQGDEPTDAMVQVFVRHLRERGWRTRAELIGDLAIPGLRASAERKCRRLAELAGDAVVRGPKGFNHFENVDLDEARHCARISIDQGKHMIRWGIGLLRRCHARIG